MDLALSTAVQQSQKLVDFILGNEEYAVPIEFVKEIIRKPEVTELPNAPSFIKGVINLRGVIIPILSLAEKFGMPHTEEAETKVMIVETGNITVGLEVNDVSEVLDLDAEQISGAPPMASSINSEFISGVGRLEDRLLIILDLQTLLEREDQFFAPETKSE